MKLPLIPAMKNLVTLSILILSCSAISAQNDIGFNDSKVSLGETKVGILFGGHYTRHTWGYYKGDLIRSWTGPGFHVGFFLNMQFSSNRVNEPSFGLQPEFILFSDLTKEGDLVFTMPMIFQFYGVKNLNLEIGPVLKSIMELEGNIGFFGGIALGAGYRKKRLTIGARAYFIKEPTISLSLGWMPEIYNKKHRHHRYR